MSELDRQERLKRLQLAFIAEMPKRIEEIEAAWSARLNSAAHQPDLLRLCHSLAGSAGTFGYAAISSAARNIEQIVQQCGETCPPAIDLQQVRHLLEEMRESCARGPEMLFFQNKQV